MRCRAAASTVKHDRIRFARSHDRQPVPEFLQFGYRLLELPLANIQGSAATPVRDAWSSNFRALAGNHHISGGGSQVVPQLCPVHAEASLRRFFAELDRVLYKFGTL